MCSVASHAQCKCGYFSIFLHIFNGNAGLNGIGFDGGRCGNIGLTRGHIGFGVLTCYNTVPSNSTQLVSSLYM